MLAMFQDLHAMAGMAGRVCGDKYRLDAIVLHQLRQRRIRLGAAACFGQTGTPLRDEVAHGRHFHIGMILKTEGRPNWHTP